MSRIELELPEASSPYNPHFDPEMEKYFHPGQSAALIYRKVCKLWDEYNGQITLQDVLEIYNNPTAKKYQWKDTTLF